jgi:hypothetical protein
MGLPGKARAPLLCAATFAVVASSVACGGKVLEDRQKSGTGDVPGPGADASVSTFAVTASGPPNTCASECVDLVAQASGGAPPYSFVWDHGLPAGAGPVRACPQVTTTYTVQAHDSASTPGAPATATASGSALVAVAVGPACGDAGDDGGVIAPGPPKPAVERCRTEWPQPQGLDIGLMQMAMDAAGNAYVAINYYGYGQPAALLNLGAMSPTTSANVAIAKIDADCNLLWARSFGRAAAAVLNDSGLDTVAIRTDAASNVTILGTFFGEVDLGAGPVSATGAGDSGFLLRLDAQGNTVFSKTLASEFADAMTPYDLAVTADGISTIAVNAGNDTDFGNGRDAGGGGAFQTHYYLVQFDAAGAELFQITANQISPDLDEVLQLATNPTGALWATGWSPTATNMGDRKPIFVGLTASAGFDWVDDGGGSPLVAGSPNGVVLLDTSGDPDVEQQTLQGYRSDSGVPTRRATWSSPGAPGRWSAARAARPSRRASSWCDWRAERRQNPSFDTKNERVDASGVSHPGRWSSRVSPGPHRSTGRRRRARDPRTIDPTRYRSAPGRTTPMRPHRRHPCRRTRRPP